MFWFISPKPRNERSDSRRMEIVMLHYSGKHSRCDVAFRLSTIRSDDSKKIREWVSGLRPF
jgi:hypothetical protein